MPDNHVPEALDGSTCDGRVSGDAMRWTPKPAPAQLTDRSLDHKPRLDPRDLAYQLADAGYPHRVFPDWAAEYDRIYAKYDAMRRLSADLTDAGVLPEQRPTDPRERALWAAKHRGTGPDRTPAGEARRSYGRRRR